MAHLILADYPTDSPVTFAIGGKRLADLRWVGHQRIRQTFDNPARKISTTFSLGVVESLFCSATFLTSGSALIDYVG